MTTHSYESPVNQLLRLGEPRDVLGWPDYLALGLRPEHITELIRMAIDPALNEAPSDSGEVWGPLHAWRALTQLRAVEAAGPLTSLFRRIDEQQDDWVGEDLPEAFGRLGPGAIPTLTTYLADAANGEWARVAAAHSLERIGTRHRQAREACVAALTHQLEQLTQQAPSLNGSLVAFLLDLQAVEAAPVIERAFRFDQVDDTVVGDWEDVQVAFGLKVRREHPRRPPPPDSPFAVLNQLTEALQSHSPVQPRADPAALGPASKSKRKRHRRRK
jgi:uncharacterized protein DUF1186